MRDDRGRFGLPPCVPAPAASRRRGQKVAELRYVINDPANSLSPWTARGSVRIRKEFCILALRDIQIIYIELFTSMEQ